MSLNREIFLPDGLEPQNIPDIFEIRKKLFDPELNSTSDRIKEGQLNPGHPDNCWTVYTFEDTLINLYKRDITSFSVQPCAHCRVNFICYPDIFSKPENPDLDVSQALLTIESLPRN